MLVFSALLSAIAAIASAVAACKMVSFAKNFLNEKHERELDDAEREFWLATSFVDEFNFLIFYSVEEEYLEMFYSEKKQIIKLAIDVSMKSWQLAKRLRNSNEGVFLSAQQTLDYMLSSFKQLTLSEDQMKKRMMNYDELKKTGGVKGEIKEDIIKGAEKIKGLREELQKKV
jgi:hypothetical protein